MATLKETEQLAGKYLTFRLGNETYGLEILRVREIIGLMNVRYFPPSRVFIGFAIYRILLIPIDSSFRMCSPPAKNANREKNEDHTVASRSTRDE